MKNLKLMLSLVLMIGLLASCQKDQPTTDLQELLTESTWDLEKMIFTSNYGGQTSTEVEAFGPNTVNGYCTLIFDEHNDFYMFDDEDEYRPSDYDLLVQQGAGIPFSFQDENTIVIADGSEGMTLDAIINSSTSIELVGSYSDTEPSGYSETVHFYLNRN